MDIERKLSFLSFAKFHFISALKGDGDWSLAEIESTRLMPWRRPSICSTPKLTRALLEAVEHQQPRRKASIRPKMRYAHQGGQNPPIVVIHGNALEAIDDSYKRYLEKHFRETFSLVGTPLRIEFKSGRNPFAKHEKNSVFLGNTRKNIDYIRIRSLWALEFFASCLQLLNTTPQLELP